jgi:Zn-dependent peptidase ImmA (M78 family)
MPADLAEPCRLGAMLPVPTWPSSGRAVVALDRAEARFGETGVREAESIATRAPDSRGGSRLPRLTGAPRPDPKIETDRGEAADVVRTAERDAQEILNTVWTAGESTMLLPVDPISIAQRLGIKVYTANMDPGVSGSLVKRAGYDDPEINLNAGDSRNRQRFTCAHEIGHYVKRSAAGEDNETWEYIDRRDSLTSTGRNPDEIYANQFAANLLMPTAHVKALRKQYGPASLAFEFGVSADAMNFRLDNLGLR